MTTINTSSNSNALLAVRGGHHHGHGGRNAAALADELFSKLDSSGQGFVKKTDLEAAVNGGDAAARNVTGKDIDALFTSFDSDGDGKLTKQEFTDSVKRLADQLNQQLRMMHAQGESQGFTKDELSSQIGSIDSSDGKRANLLNSLVQNFDKVDGNGDGRIDVKEALDFARNSADPNAVNASAASDSHGAKGGSDEAKMMQQLVKLLDAYGGNTQEEHKSASALQAVMA